MKKHFRIFKKSHVIVSGTLFLGFILLSGCKKTTNDSSTSPSGINKVNHVVVIYMENHSFDNLYGEFPGANGLYNAASANIIQTDSNNNAYTHLPAVIGSPNASAFPTNLANKYFNIDQYVPAGQITPDVLHRYYQEQMQINGGKMDKYAVYNSNSKGLSQGYYQTSLLPMTPIAQKYVLCDNFFHSAFGGSFLNHMWLIAAASPTFPNAPSGIIATLDPTGKLLTDGQVSPDGYVINTSFTVNTPHPSSVPTANLVPNQTIPTIGDRLNDKSVSWAWYSGGWNDAVAGNPANTFQFHHQPFAFFANYADGTPGKAAHLKDESDFFAAANNGTLPAVSFVKPLGAQNEHPGYANVLDGENHIVALINAVLNGPNGKDAVIVITYDENGGFWDHVAPPVVDKWGPGTRVPAIIVSPFAKTGYIDHTQYETLSILSFIEKRWGLTPLNTRDQNADPLSNAFNF